MPPAVDQFSEEFAGFPIESVIDFWASYFQLSLDPTSRDLTAVLTALGLLRNTRLPMGWTNSVACFQRVIVKVLWEHLEHAKPFIDDVGIKGPKSRYGDVEIFPGMRKFVWEHLQILRGILGDIWRSGLTISGKKSAFAMPAITIVGMLCTADGRQPDRKKVQKILDWPTPRSVREARGFIGICVYYRIFVRGFSVTAAPILELFRKSTVFSWNAARQDAMDQLKKQLTEAPILISLDFSPSALPIHLTVDASKVGWGAVLQQDQSDGTRRPARFESGIWSDVEQKYDAVKLECRGLLKALKKFRFWLFGRHFMMETDVQTLVWLVNQPPNDLPNAMLTRWLTYIRLFDFDVRHVQGRKNGVADSLSRRGKAPEDDEDDGDDDDVDDFFDARLYSITVTPPANPTARVWLVDAEYSGEDLVIAQYLEIL